MRVIFYFIFLLRTFRKVELTKQIKDGLIISGEWTNSRTIAVIKLH